MIIQKLSAHETLLKPHSTQVLRSSRDDSQCYFQPCSNFQLKLCMQRVSQECSRRSKMCSCAPCARDLHDLPFEYACLLNRFLQVRRLHAQPVSKHPFVQLVTATTTLRSRRSREIIADGRCPQTDLHERCTSPCQDRRPLHHSPLWDSRTSVSGAAMGSVPEVITSPTAPVLTS